MAGIYRVFCTPTVTVDQEKYDNLIRIADRYKRYEKSFRKDDF